MSYSYITLVITQNKLSIGAKNKYYRILSLFLNYLHNTRLIKY